MGAVKSDQSASNFLKGVLRRHFDYRLAFIEAQDIRVAIALRSLQSLSSSQRLAVFVSSSMAELREERLVVRKAATTVSSSPQMRETSDFEIPSTPKAFNRSSTFRVETPWTYASWTTASNACSARRRGCSNEGQ
jgi:hypothetical protein